MWLFSIVVAKEGCTHQMIDWADRPGFKPTNNQPEKLNRCRRCGRASRPFQSTSSPSTRSASGPTPRSRWVEFLLFGLGVVWVVGWPVTPPPPNQSPHHQHHPKKQSMLAGPDGQLDSKRRLLAGLGAGVTEAVRVCVFAACRASCHVCFLCLGASITRQPRSSQLLHPQTPHNKLPKNNRFLSSLPSMW